MSKIKSTREKRERRHKRLRAKISGTTKRPRLCVFRSNKYIYAQVIDDEKNKVLVSVNDSKMKVKKSSAKSVLKGKTALAFEVGKKIAELVQEKKINQVVFDRGGYKYHGRVKALAEGARTQGLKF